MYILKITYFTFYASLLVASAHAQRTALGADPRGSILSYDLKDLGDLGNIFTIPNFLGTGGGTDSSDPTAVPGRIPGALSVGQMGAANYTVPIVVPPGVSGIQPSLAITYSSEAGNGPLGVGFYLSGLMKISRGGADIDRDGFRGGINFDADDRFFFNGMRLMQQDATQDYGALGVDGKEYRTDPERFWKVVSRGTSGNGPAWFEVHGPKGLLYEFGGNTSSQEGRVFVPGSSNVYEWRLSKLSDRDGNSMNYTYADNGKGQVYLSTIEYVEKSNGQMDSRVSFVMEDRPDDTVRYLGGGKIETTKRLAAIETFAAGSRVFRYQLSYEVTEPESVNPGGEYIAIRRSRLVSLRLQEGVNLDYLGDTTFDWKIGLNGAASAYAWQDGPSPFFSSVAGEDALDRISVDQNRLRLADVNGDGRKDLYVIRGHNTAGLDAVYLHNGTYDPYGDSPIPSGISSFVSSDVEQAKSDVARIRLADFNGDGRADVYLVKGVDGTPVLDELYYSNGDGTFASPVPGIPSVVTSTIVSQLADISRIRIGDFNGDRRMDIYYVNSFSGNILDPSSPSLNTPDHLYIATDTGFEAAVDGPNTSDPIATLLNLLDQFHALFRTVSAMVNLEGVPTKDYTRNPDGSIATAMHAFRPDFRTASSSPSHIRLGDFNGDGRTDVYWVRGSIASTSIDEIFYCEKDLQFSSSIPGLDTPIRGGGFGMADYLRVVSGDFNSDGLTDILYWKSAGGGQIYLPAVHYNQGDGTFSFGYTTSPCIRQRTPSLDALSLASMKYVDANSDGYIDLYWPQTSLGNCGSISSTDAPATIFLMDGRGYTDGRMAGGFPLSDFSGNPPLEIESVAASSEILDDINGDGIMDIYWLRDIGQVNQSHIVRPGLVLQPRVIGVTDGLGLHQRIVYKTLASGAIYDGPTDAPFDATRTHDAVPANFYAVDRVLQSDGMGGYRTNYYSFGGLLTDRLKGSLGFRTQRTWNPDAAREIVSTSYQNIDGPMGLERYDIYRHIAGTPRLVEQRNFVRANEINATTGNFRSWLQDVWVSELSADSGHLRKAWGAFYVYDNYLNPTDEVFTRANGETDTTAVCYINDEANWLIGQPEEILLSRRDDYTYRGLQTTFTYKDQQPWALDRKAVSWEEPTATPSVYIPREQSHYYFYNEYGQVGLVLEHGSDTSIGLSLMEESPHGRFLSSVINSLGHQTQMEADPGKGLSLSRTDPNGNQVLYDYDAFGRPQSKESPDQDSYEITYEFPAGNAPAHTAMQIVKTYASGASSISYIDALGRAIATRSSSIEGKPDVVMHDTYNPDGTLATSELPRFDGAPSYQTTYEYDHLLRPTLSTFPNGDWINQQYIGFNPALQLEGISVESSSGQLGYSGFRHGRQIISTQGTIANPILTRMDVDYDVFDTPVSNTVNQVNPVLHSQDEIGRTFAELDPSHGLRGVDYDVYSKPKQISQNGVVLATTDYDPLNRLIEQVTPDYTATYVYDTASNGIGLPHTVTVTPTHVNDVGLEKELSYNLISKMDRFTQTVDGQSDIIFSTFDGLGRVDTMMHPGGFSIQQVYDTKGQLKELRDPANPSIVYWTWTDKAADGRVTRIELGNGVTAQHIWTPDDRLLESIDALNQYGVRVCSEQYQYNSANQLDSLLDLRSNYVSLQQFNYDGLNRLTNEVYNFSPLTTVGYDEFGNILNKSDIGNYTYQSSSTQWGPRPYAVDQAGTHSLGYNDDGEVTQLENLNIDYSVSGRVREISDGTRTLWIQRDETGSRVRQVISGDIDETWTFVGGNYVRRETGCRTDHFTYFGPGKSFVAVHIKSEFDASCPAPTQERILYLHHDRQGSLKTVTDHTGYIQVQYQYDAWGKRTSELWNDSTLADLISCIQDGYTGHAPLRGFPDMWITPSRVYHAGIGRFLSPDPTVPDFFNPADHNRYSYVRNDPMNYTDPSGFDPAKMNPFVVILPVVEVSALRIGKSRTENYNPLHSPAMSNTRLEDWVNNGFELPDYGADYPYENLGLPYGEDESQIRELMHGWGNSMERNFGEALDWASYLWVPGADGMIGAMEMAQGEKEIGIIEIIELLSYIKKIQKINKAKKAAEKAKRIAEQRKKIRALKKKKNPVHDQGDYDYLVSHRVQEAKRYSSMMEQYRKRGMGDVADEMDATMKKEWKDLGDSIRKEVGDFEEEAFVKEFQEHFDFVDGGLDAARPYLDAMMGR